MSETPPQPDTALDHLQQRGRHYDIIQKAVADYDEWMLDDDYDAMTKLHGIMGQMRARLALSDQPDTAPSPLSTGEVRYDNAAFKNTDDGSADLVLAAVLHCANSWDGNARLLGNVRASDISRACDIALAALSQPPATEQIRREVIEKIIKKMIRSGELSEYRTYDDCGLEVGEYVDLICKVSALALLQTESKA